MTSPCRPLRSFRISPTYGAMSAAVCRKPRLPTMPRGSPTRFRNKTPRPQRAGSWIPRVGSQALSPKLRADDGPAGVPSSEAEKAAPLQRWLTLARRNIAPTVPLQGRPRAFISTPSAAVGCTSNHAHLELFRGMHVTTSQPSAERAPIILTRTKYLLPPRAAALADAVTRGQRRLR